MLKNVYPLLPIRTLHTLHTLAAIPYDRVGALKASTALVLSHDGLIEIDPSTEGNALCMCRCSDWGQEIVDAYVKAGWM